MRNRLLLAGVVLALIPVGAKAQDWRDMTSFRQHSDENRMDVHVRYGAGELLIRRGDPGELYRVNLHYDSDVFDPVVDYRSGDLQVGVEGRNGRVRLRNTKAGELRLQLSPEIPLALNLDFGAVEADLDLGGLQVISLDVETGASDTEIRFEEPNPAVCDRFDISMGAAAFTARGLGNVGCDRLTAEGGVGDLTLDFEGAWPRDMDADITMALGSVTLVIPANIGVRVDKDTFLTDFDRDGFYKSGDTYYSDSWETATRRLTIHLEGAFGSMSVRWAPPTEGEDS
jgi:hypothetical protein